MVSACQNSQNSFELDVTWRIKAEKFEIKDRVYTVEAVVQYDGSTIDEVHEQNPSTGYVYLILNATISKINPQSTVSFDWKKISIEDASGSLYPRMENDTFIEQYQYTPRITGLELRFGEYQGWMCFEIPAPTAEGKNQPGIYRC